MARKRPASKPRQASSAGAESPAGEDQSAASTPVAAEPSASGGASKAPHSYAYPRPAVTVDVVVLTPRANDVAVLLIKRATYPFADCWALPGGFANENESLRAAARRELCEETAAVVDSLWPIDTFSDPGRDPRGWTISMAYYTLARHDGITVRGGDDARVAEWHSLDTLPALAFDHGSIIQAAVAQMGRDLFTLPIVRDLLPLRATWADLVGLQQRLFRYVPPPWYGPVGMMSDNVAVTPSRHW